MNTRYSISVVEVMEYPNSNNDSNDSYDHGYDGYGGYECNSNSRISSHQDLLAEFEPMNRLQNQQQQQQQQQQNQQHDSAMRIATDQIPTRNRREFNRTRRQRIFIRRGSFEWLPIYLSNDLVVGSWWFVIGSVIATLIPIVPLCDLFYGFWEHSGTLPILQDAATFSLLIVSGVFFTLGSLAFVRATEEPPLKPLFPLLPHFETDELLAAWLFLFGTVPFPAFMAVYVYYYSHVMIYWGALIGSLVFVVATYIFVLACYPTDEPRDQIIPYLLHFFCTEDSWIHKHLSNDWLAGTWIFLFGTLIMCLGSFSMLVNAILDHNSLEIFDWGSSFVDSIIFLIGSAYFCAGSYPQELNRPPHIILDIKKEATIEHQPLIDSRSKIHIR